MLTRTIKYNANGWTADITVSEATLGMGMKRERLKATAQAVADKIEDVDARLLAVYLFPDLVAATTHFEAAFAGDENAPAIEHHNVPEFDQFITLPDALVTQWNNATYAINPHWLLQPAPAEGSDNHPNRIADRLTLRLGEFLADEDDEDISMPDAVTLNTDFETAWRWWTLTRATGGKLPLVRGGLKDQPEVLIEDVLLIEGLANQMRVIQMKRKSRPEGKGNADRAY